MTRQTTTRSAVSSGSEQITREARQQFDQLFQRSYRRAYTLAYRLTGNAADAEDVTQDAYLRAWCSFDRYDANGSFEGWLFRIIINRVIDLRRQRRLRMVPLDTCLMWEEGKSLTYEFASRDSDPEEILFASILDERLERAVTSLPDDHRQPLLLYAMEQSSYQQIADTMHCAIGTVRSRLHRGRQSVRRTLECRNIPGARRRSETNHPGGG
jgi:RNA polymerase sigma-70 factor (ECF subfamily)